MKANAFRVIKKELLEAYKTGDVSQIPNLEGFNYNKKKTVNTFYYDNNEQYLHFFDTYSNAKQYLNDLPHNKNDEYCICEFYFDDEFLQKK